MVGVIANLTLWFGLHVLFRQFTPLRMGLLHLDIPQIGAADWAAVGLSIVAAVLLFRLHLGVIKTLAVCIVLGLGLFALGLT